MNDRYLYRAKRTDNGEWVEGMPLFYQDGSITIYGQKQAQTVGFHIQNNGYCDRNTLCQCTGLKDKNGKMIWENDIVEFLGHKGKVKYECGSFGIAYIESIDWEEIEENISPITGCDNALYACENDNYISLWEIHWNFNDEDDCLSTVEVIGSVFDNPELLEVGE